MDRDFPIDRINLLEKNNRIIVNKFLPFNELIFTEHFPETQVYPGSMILNTVLAACHLLLQASIPDIEVRLHVIGKLTLKKPLKPGKIIEVVIDWERQTQGLIMFKFTVNGHFCRTLYSAGKVTYIMDRKVE
jgi:3-hydroxymyristoyl/3-hydroxydecanoyl-(acyl carrier protein) dehydratase